MAFCCRPNSRSRSSTPRSPTRDQSPRDFAVRGQKIKPSSTKDSTKSKISKSKIVVKPSSTPLASNPSLSPIVKMDSHSRSPALITDSEEKVNMSDHHSCKTDEVKDIPSKEKPEIEKCAICLDDCTEPKRLDKCSHTFCTDCIDHYFQAIKPQCPCCFTIYGEIRGNQPDNGTMKHTILKSRLPGFGRDSFGTIQITYHFPDGIQNEKHPNPGMPYYGTTREAYLPDNSEGRHVLELLQRAFKLRQIFTIGQSRTTGCDNVVTWNDVHHKTNIHGGMENFGYPDKTYLNRVQQELAAKGIK